MSESIDLELGKIEAFLSKVAGGSWPDDLETRAAFLVAGFPDLKSAIKSTFSDLAAKVQNSEKQLQELLDLLSLLETKLRSPELVARCAVVKAQTTANRTMYQRLLDSRLGELNDLRILFRGPERFINFLATRGNEELSVEQQKQIQGLRLAGRAVIQGIPSIGGISGQRMDELEPDVGALKGLLARLDGVLNQPESYDGSLDERKKADRDVHRFRFGLANELQIALLANSMVANSRQLEAAAQSLSTVNVELSERLKDIVEFEESMSRIGAFIGVLGVLFTFVGGP